MRFVVLGLWAWAILARPLAAAAADPAAILTLLEGSATMVRGVARYALAEGVRLQSGDIVEVGDKSIAEMEFADGTALTLGPETRVFALSLPRAKQAHGDFYVPQGVLKIGRVKQGSRLRVVTPLLTLQPLDGAAVLLLGGASASVFVETGAARLSGPGAQEAALQLRAGDFFSGKTPQRSSVGPRPSPAFIGALPRLFLDPLPSRLARFRDRAAPPRRLDLVRYEQVETWLKAPYGIRHSLPRRFQSRAADPAFRAALVANLKSHPEWDPILFPEKYPPKEPAQAAPAPPAARR